MAASVLVDRAQLSMVEAAVWADALALLVEDGQDDGPQALLSRLVDQVTAARVRRALVGDLRLAEDRLAAAAEEVFRTAVEVPADELPSWAETGIVDPAGGHRVFGKHTLDLDAAELADGMPWPPMTVMAFQVSGAPAGVLLEVGPGGLPHRLFAPQARRIGAALLDAAELADEVNA